MQVAYVQREGGEPVAGGTGGASSRRLRDREWRSFCRMKPDEMEKYRQEGNKSTKKLK